jgi:hypothetical protein
MNVQIEIDDERVFHLLTSALEGGSNYWYMMTEYHIPAGNEAPEFPWHKAPFLEGGYTLFADKENPEDKTRYRLNREAMEKGLQLLAKEYPHHFKDFIEENDDAETADVWLQLSLFGEVLYA